MTASVRRHRLTQDDEGIHEVVLEGVPPGPEALHPLGVALDLLAQLPGDGGHGVLAVVQSPDEVSAGLLQVVRPLQGSHAPQNRVGLCVKEVHDCAIDGAAALVGLSQLAGYSNNDCYINTA